MRASRIGSGSVYLRPQTSSKRASMRLKLAALSRLKLLVAQPVAISAIALPVLARTLTNRAIRTKDASTATMRVVASVMRVVSTEASITAVATTVPRSMVAVTMVAVTMVAVTMVATVGFDSL